MSALQGKSIVKRERTIEVVIYIAGDYSDALRICRKFCAERGACVSVQKVDYIYTGGEETGVSVRFINYPRFPSDRETLLSKAKDLGNRLMLGLYQSSFSIVDPDFTHFVTRREEDMK